MRLVVDLNDEVYNNMVIKNEYTDRDVIAVHNALMGATRIPKGHGRLIDADEDFCFDEPIAWMPLPEHYVEDETDWFDAEVTDKSKDSLTVEVKVKADHVWDVRNAVVDCVLNILDRYYLWHLYEDGTYVTVGEEIKAAVLALKGGHG